MFNKKLLVRYHKMWTFEFQKEYRCYDVWSIYCAIWLWYIFVIIWYILVCDFYRFSMLDTILPTSSGIEVIFVYLDCTMVYKIMVYVLSCFPAIKSRLQVNIMLCRFVLFNYFNQVNYVVHYHQYWFIQCNKYLWGN